LTGFAKYAVVLEANHSPVFSLVPAAGFVVI
jgi:hypothetical protein